MPMKLKKNLYLEQTFRDYVWPLLFLDQLQGKPCTKEMTTSYDPKLSSHQRKQWQLGQAEAIDQVECHRS